jgi:beta-xylosidase
MGLVREDGSLKPAFDEFRQYAPELGICQWIHFEDHRLDATVKLLNELGVKRLRTGLSWADSFRPDAEKWFDVQMKSLEPFDVTLTFCFTPQHCGLEPNHTSPPKNVGEFADFCARMTRRYAS